MVLCAGATQPSQNAKALAERSDQDGSGSRATLASGNEGGALRDDS